MVGRTSCVDAPLQGFSYGVILRVAFPLHGRPSQGWSRLSEFLSGRRSGALVRRSLLVVSTTPRSFVVRPVSNASVRDDSHRLGPPSQGTSLTADPQAAALGCPSWSLAPFQRHGRQGPLHPGLPLPARSARGVSHPLDGLLPCHVAASRAAAIHRVSSLVSGVRHGLPRLATRRAGRSLRSGLTL